MNKCTSCAKSMNFMHVRKQYGRLMRRGFTTEQVKVIQPRCQKCVTVWLKGHTPATAHPQPESPTAVPSGTPAECAPCPSP